MEKGHIEYNLESHDGNFIGKDQLMLRMNVFCSVFIWMRSGRAKLLHDMQSTSNGTSKSQKGKILQKKRRMI